MHGNSELSTFFPDFSIDAWYNYDYRDSLRDYREVTYVNSGNYISLKGRPSSLATQATMSALIRSEKFVDTEMLGSAGCSRIASFLSI